MFNKNYILGRKLYVFKNIEYVPAYGHICTHLKMKDLWNKT